MVAFLSATSTAFAYNAFFTKTEHASGTLILSNQLQIKDIFILGNNISVAVEPTNKTVAGHGYTATFLVNGLNNVGSANFGWNAAQISSNLVIVASVSNVNLANITSIEVVLSG